MTKFSDLVNHTSTFTKFPVPVEDVRLWFIEHGYQSEIKFFPVEIDPNITLGQMAQFTCREGAYSDPKFVTYITYSESLNLCWQRFVLTKEMTHIIDPASVRTKTTKGIKELTEELAYKVPVKDGSDANHYEKLAIYRALAILAPKEAVDQIKPRLQSGELTSYDVALFFRIPEHFIPALMSKRYEEKYDELLNGD